MNLSPEQQAIRDASDAPGTVLHVVAGAGSGKTTALVARAARLARTGPVAVVTFTNDAADEISERMRELEPGRTWIWTGTLHAWAYDLLNRIPVHAGRTVLDAREYAELVAEAAHAAGRPGKRLDAILHSWIMESHSIGYDGLIELARHWLTEPANRIEARELVQGRILIDEAQDLDGAQHDLVEALVALGVHVTLIGDPRQSIYRFRGATPERWNPQAPLALTTNRRSGAAIVDHANGLPGATGWPAMAWRTADGFTDAHIEHVETLRDAIRFHGTLGVLSTFGGTLGILCRTWGDAARAAGDLTAEGIPYSMAPRPERDGNALRTAAVRWIRLCAASSWDANLAWLTAAALGSKLRRSDLNPGAWGIQHGVGPVRHLTQIGHLPATARKTATVSQAIDELVGWLRVRGRAADADAVAGMFPGTTKQTVASFSRWWSFGRSNEPVYLGPTNIMTVHGAKGLEWDAVIVLGVRWTSPDPEERAIAYVAATRARSTLVIVDRP